MNYNVTNSAIIIVKKVNIVIFKLILSYLSIICKIYWHQFIHNKTLHYIYVKNLHKVPYIKQFKPLL